MVSKQSKNQGQLKCKVAWFFHGTKMPKKTARWEGGRSKENIPKNGRYLWKSGSVATGKLPGGNRHQVWSKKATNGPIGGRKENSDMKMSHEEALWEQCSPFGSMVLKIYCLRSTVRLRARIIPPNPEFELYKISPTLLKLRFFWIKTYKVIA